MEKVDFWFNENQKVHTAYTAYTAYKKCIKKITTCSG